MAGITKIKNKFRVRYRLYHPDGTYKDRSRQVDKKGQARELKSLADILESKTRLQDYSGQDIDTWWRKQLINRKDREQLQVYPDGRKALRLAADEVRKTWDVCKKERDAREARMTHILECLGEETPIDSFRHSDGEWLKTWLRDKGYKAETVNKHIKDLKRMFALQVAERTIDFHPFSEIKGLKIPPEEKIDYFIPNEEQIQIIFKKAEENDRKNRPLFKGRLTLFLLLLFGCGLRLSEAMETKIENIDWETRGLLVIKTKSKKPRMVGLGKKLYQQLLPLRGQEGFILPRLSLDWVSRGITKHLHRCGFNKMRPHDIRHTYVTLLQEKNVSPIDAMGRTGHSDMQMLSHYSHPKLGIIFEDQFEFMQE